MCGSNSKDSWWADAVALARQGQEEAEAAAKARLKAEEHEHPVLTERAVQPI